MKLQTLSAFKKLDRAHLKSIVAGGSGVCPQQGDSCDPSEPVSCILSVPLECIDGQWQAPQGTAPGSGGGWYYPWELG